MSVRDLIFAANIPSVPAAVYQYWRVFIVDGNGASIVSINEIELRSSIGGLDLTTPSVPTLESSFLDFNFRAGRTVNNILTTAEAWISSSGSNTNQYVSYDLGSLQGVAQMALYITTDPTRAPKNLIVQGSNNGLAGPWTDVKTFSNITGWSIDTWRTFDL